MLQRLNWLPAGVAIAAMFVLPACDRGRDTAPVEHKTEPAAKPAAAAPAPIGDDSLDRKGMILAVLGAMSDAALGRQDAEAQRALGGRKFAVRIRFGCPGADDPDRGWSYDDKKGVLRVNVRSVLTEDSIPASDLLARDYQGMVGFALGKPWLLSAGCPRGGFDAVATAQPGIVIAQLFTVGDSPVQRPQREYRLTRPTDPNQQPSDGLDLLLSGRLAELADGRPIHCAAKDGAPACLVSARIDRVAIENPASGKLLGEWGSGVGRAD
jgi:hypothetical protein